MDLFAPRHLLIILLVVLVVFGTKKLKTIGSDLGGAIKGFKKAMADGESAADAVKSAVEPPPQIAAAATPAAKTTADATQKTGI